MPELVSTDEKISYSLEQIHEAARKLLNAGKGTNVWALHGPMGSGKTTLTKTLLIELGSHETVASPTFSIVNEYRSSENEPVYHFDFYRIKNEMEAYDIGTDEYFDSGHLCLVEWPEKIPSLLPVQHFEIHIEIVDEQSRLIHYRKHA
ncbi:MAG: tRNA (adenosine(37)-N6)-threonylcarbamoyltransferase complex ATPase subunit type 1 TsaE [Bacteroidetes bacterium]|nr:tRNA (adenosine(37)-N6)-threonylcarbamoyltransferase complex ATPase subunit type 1 TsaE [Bacteroidota bacterium]MBI3483018.1 tRNA (adenosine(37)-N6)-threonylcarbamoyltransferase complex ATPase subunit type 1 TsaE [Bacteroidota bacterium]